LSPLTNFNINFEDRQELKIIEDLILDLQVILPSLLNSMTGVYNQCMHFFQTSELSQEEKCQLGAILEDLEENIQEGKMFIERAKTLKEKAKSTTQLVRNLKDCPLTFV
jgi:hypothetical protein